LFQLQLLSGIQLVAAIKPHAAMYRILIVTLLSVLPALARDDKGVSIAGQVFITTQNGDAVKMSSVPIYAFPISGLTAFDTYGDTVNLPAPLAKVVSDADGAFRLVVPGSDDFFIFAQGQRLVHDSPQRSHFETFEWLIKSDDIADGERLLLNEANARPQTPKHIVIAEN